MTLDDFLSSPATTMTKADLASALGVSQISVNRWLAETRFPDKETILRIEELTGGRVQPADWYRPTHRQSSTPATPEQAA